MKANPKFGIVQGRLIKSPPGQLQWFPQREWEAEFQIAKDLGFAFVELIAERQHNPENPIWTDAGVERIKSLAQKLGLEIHAFCNDYVIDHDMTKGRDVLEQNLKLIERGALLGAQKYILPLFEKSELNNDNFDAYEPVIREIGRFAATRKITVCLETILQGLELKAFIERLDCPNVKAVFDTGNRVAFGHDLAGDIVKLGALVEHVHIKDKNAQNENVLLGRGKVDFLDVFRALKKIDYSGPMTFESQRGTNPTKTAKQQMQYVEFLVQEALAE